MKVPLNTGAYSARSLIAAAQSCINLYAEKNPEDEIFPKTYYPTPGLVTRATSTDKIWRALYVSTTDRCFGVVGRSVVEIKDDYSLTVLGTILSINTPCYFLDNGTTLVLIDGSSAGYQMDLTTNVVSNITDPAFYGSNRIDYMDGFTIFNRPDTRQFYITLVNQMVFDPLDFASKTGFADKLVGHMVTRRNLFLFGEQTTEIWTNTGGNAFPFSRIGGAFFQFGCASADSLAQADGSIYFISKTPQGECMVMRTVNYDRERISTFALELELQGYETISDAIGWTQQMGGHIWYVLTFPTAGKTWVFDASGGEWHERTYLLEDGSFARHRGNCYAFWRGRHLTGDYENGKLYEMSFDVFTDDGNEIRRVRSFPHMADDGNRVAYRQLQAAMQCGAAGYGQESEVRLRYSDNQGYSWSGYVSSSLGSRGEYLRDVRFLRLGMARNRVFELSWTAGFQTALSGAYLQVERSSS